MFQIDDKFLEEVGLTALPDDQRTPFLQYVYDQLEYRVGVNLSEGLSDNQLEEFSDIADGKTDVVVAWLAANAPNYADEELFQKIQAASGLEATNPSLLGEYASTKWLEVNRPDYRTVVGRTLEVLKQEIIQNNAAILGQTPQPSQVPQAPQTPQAPQPPQN